jgi:hypothetical protein
MYDFTHIVDFIFKKKDEYKKLSDEDKEKNFFIINRKFARGFPSHAQYVNNKSVDRASALDIWYQFFIKKRTNGIPSWYWFKQETKREKSIITKDDVELLMQFYDIKERDVDFLIKYYPEDVKEEVKKFHKFEN